MSLWENEHTITRLTDNIDTPTKCVLWLIDSLGVWRVNNIDHCVWLRKILKQTKTSSKYWRHLTVWVVQISLCLARHKCLIFKVKRDTKLKWPQHIEPYTTGNRTPLPTWSTSSPYPTEIGAPPALQGPKSSASHVQCLSCQLIK